MRKNIPACYINRKNTIIQIIFTSLFAFAFINLYKPFGAGEWYEVSWWMFSLASSILVITGMLVVIVSRVFMFLFKRNKPISILYYILMIAGEIIFMAAFYALLEKIVMNDIRTFWERMYFSVQNTALILLIPYIITILFFEWQEKKMSLEKIIKQISHKPDFISFKDHKGNLMLTLKINDLSYIESSDNYVVIHYNSTGKTKTYLLRNSLKKLEKEFIDLPLVRCHRSFMVNINFVKMMKREKKTFKLFIDDFRNISIPVSETYMANVSKVLGSKIVQE